MKKLLLAIMMMVPMVATANPYLGDCEAQYEAARDIMMLRQNGVPMPEFIRMAKSFKPEDFGVSTDSQLALFYEAERETVRIIERAYAMPNFGFMDSVAQTMADEFANQHYVRCRRLAR